MVLSSTGCKVPWALRGGCGCCDSLRREYEAFSLHIPDAGSLDLQLPCAGRPRRGLPAASLGSAASVVRAMGLCEKMRFLRGPCFSKNAKQGLVISRGIGYTASRIKKKSDCFPPVAAGDLETVVFYCTPFTVSVFCSIHARSLSFATSTRDAMCRVGKSSRCRS